VEELPGGPGDEADGRNGASEYVIALTRIRRDTGKFRPGADHFGLAVPTKRYWTRNFISVFSGRLPTLFLLVTAPHQDSCANDIQQSDQPGQSNPG
jgi:hypothetical protein